MGRQVRCTGLNLLGLYPKSVHSKCINIGVCLHFLFYPGGGHSQDHQTHFNYPLIIPSLKPPQVSIMKIVTKLCFPALSKMLMAKLRCWSALENVNMQWMTVPFLEILNATVDLVCIYSVWNCYIWFCCGGKHTVIVIIFSPSLTGNGYPILWSFVGKDCIEKWLEKKIQLTSEEGEENFWLVCSSPSKQ